MDKQDIGYVGATLETEDPERVYLLILMYTSFAASLWIMQALSDFANRAMEAFKGWKGGSLKRLSAIRSLRLFCESFIAEAQPIQVRLTEKYLEISEPIFKASRLPEIFSQISSQLTNLSQETEVIESKLSLSRDRKVGLAAAAIAVLSGLSAAYDLS